MLTICGTGGVADCAAEVEELCGRSRADSGVVIAAEIDGRMNSIYVGNGKTNELNIGLSSI